MVWPFINSLFDWDQYCLMILLRKKRIFWKSHEMAQYSTFTPKHLPKYASIVQFEIVHIHFAYFSLFLWFRITIYFLLWAGYVLIKSQGGKVNYFNDIDKRKTEAQSEQSPKMTYLFEMNFQSQVKQLFI